MAIRRHGMFVREFAVLHGSGGVLLGVIVLAEIVVMGRLDPPLTFRGPERALGRSVSRAENQDVS
jgi:hypothetical protein